MIKIKINNINRVRIARHMRDLSLEDLSAKTGINIATLSKIENQKIEFRMQDAEKIAEALDIPLQFFFKANQHFMIVSTFD